MKENKTIPVRYFVSTLFFLIGIAAAVLLTYKIKPAKEDESIASQPRHDTVFVKLLDQVFTPNISNEEKPQVNDSSISKTKNITGNKIADSNKTTSGNLNLPLQTEPKLQPNNPPDIQEQITTEATNNAKELNNKYAVNKASSFNTWAGFFISLIIVFSAFLSKDDRLENAQVTDTDPQDMQDLFKEFTDKINLLRNPRKILRFKNMVKYHYYFLKKSNISDMSSLKKMMWVLFGIQEDPSLINISNIPSEKLSDPDWFYQRIKSKAIWFVESDLQENDKDLMMLILKLNVDMGA